MAGVTVGLIAFPLAIALGIASIPSGTETPLAAPAIGLLTAIFAGFIISSLGGSRVQISGPTAAFIPIIILIISEHGYSGLLLATMMAGIILIIMGITRMGMLIKFIPWPVISGFTTGIAIAIIISQLPDLMGLMVNEPAPHEFFEKLGWLVKHADSLNPYSFGLALGCIAVILMWPRLKISWLPGSIIAILVGSLLVLTLGWSEYHEVATVGSKFGSNALVTGIPKLLFPAWDLVMVRSLIGPALAIALLGAIESLLSAVVADGLSGDRHDSNTELIAHGIANLVCPFFGGLPATGAIARTSANINNGGKTPLAGMIHALTLLLIVSLGASMAGYIPMACMSAILIVVAIKLGEWHEFSKIRRMPASDAIVMLSTCSLTVIFDMVIAVQVGMVLAAMLFIKRVSETTEVSLVTDQDVLERPEQIPHGKSIPENVLVYRIFGPFLFGAAEKMENALDRVEKWPQVLILQMHLVTAMDTTGLNALENIVERMQARGSLVILSGIHHQPLQLLRNAGFIGVIGRENFCATLDDALKRAKDSLKA
jgi:sulfate permease, SulP family